MQCFDVLLLIFSKELKIITISLWMLGMTRRCISGDRRGWKMWFTGNVLFMSHSSLYWLTLAAWEGAAVYFQPLSILFIAIVPTILLDSTHREPEQWLSSELPGAEWGTSVGRSCFQLGWAHSAADQVLSLHSACLFWIVGKGVCSRFVWYVHLRWDFKLFPSSSSLHISTGFQTQGQVNAGSCTKPSPFGKLCSKSFWWDYFAV